MSTKSIRETLAFQDLTEEEKKARGILGRLYGPCASIVDATRNGRKYSEQLWQNVFTKNEIVKEMFANGGIPMQLDHPVGREQTDSTRIAAMLPAPPMRDKDGHLICYIDIIDTPCGKIAYQLAKYGFKLGISSRGTGDLYTDEYGDQAVDPETYDFTTFDLVIVPAVKDARLVMQSLEGDKVKKLKHALKQSYNSLTDETEKAIMLDEMNKLTAKLEGKPHKKSPQAKTQIDDKQTHSQTATQVQQTSGDDITEQPNPLLDSLKQSIRSKAACEQKLLEMKRQKAVTDSKVKSLEQELAKYKSALARTSVLAGRAKKLEMLAEKASKKIVALQESLSTKDAEIEKLQQKLNASRKLTQSVDASNQKVKNLITQVAKKDAKIQELTESLSSQTQEANQKIRTASRVANKYKTQYEQLMEHYIESKASMLSIRPTEITRRLDESFTAADIDKVCEELLTESLNYSKLPINVTGRQKVRVQESISTEQKLSGKNTYGGYEIDDSLLELAGLK